MATKAASTLPSLRDVPLDVTPLGGYEPVAAFFCGYPLLLTPSNLILKFWHAEVLLLYRDGAGRYGLDLFDRGGLVDSRMTAVFFRTVEPKRIRWHHVRCLRMDPARGFWMRYRCCFRHVNLHGVDPNILRTTLHAAIQHRLHPEGFSYFEHRCCYNFASDLMDVIASVPKSSTFRRVPFWQTNICASCCSRNFGAYLIDNGFDDARVDLATQEFHAKSVCYPYGICDLCCLAARRPSLRRKRRSPPHEEDPTMTTTSPIPPLRHHDRHRPPTELVVRGDSRISLSSSAGRSSGDGRSSSPCGDGEGHTSDSSLASLPSRPIASSDTLSRPSITT